VEFTFGSAAFSAHSLEIGLRLLLAVGLAGVIGLDRELGGHAAGLRTHMLTALASAVFTIAAIEFFREVRDSSQQMSADPIRAIEAVTAGAGFLGAGAILHARGRVVGVTTGACIWLSAAIGLAAGAGNYAVAVFATVLAAAILIVLKRFEQSIRRWRDKHEMREEGPPPPPA